MSLKASFEILFKKNLFGPFFRCWSYIGKRGGEQVLSLRPPDEKHCHCLCDAGRVLHEMMHALGFYHEHTRPDRDQHIQIVPENVKKGLAFIKYLEFGHTYINGCLLLSL